MVARVDSDVPSFYAKQLSALSSNTKSVASQNSLAEKKKLIMVKKKRPLTQAEIWDDSALQQSWDDAVAEYKVEISDRIKGYFTNCFVALS